ncbi:MAG: efflux RND transporter periplasmic adaptor subunit [Oscillochloris sp.]|nr:efflux RND transporter periplasmic adaptor subunit [Oscillochloris sp.]
MTSVPQNRSRGLRRPSWPVMIALFMVVAVVITLAGRNFLAAPPDPLADLTLVPVTRGSLTLGVSATGSVEPRIQADLTFDAAAGRVNEVLVAEGDQVRAGDPLIQLDARQLNAELTAAQANLAVAEADLLAVREGATPEQIAEAEAQVAAAQGSLAQTESSVTGADIAAARAGVDEARVRLAELERGPKSDAVTRATTAVEEARAELERQRSALTAAKEQARIRVEQAANSVREAQSTYSTAYWDNEHVKNNETDPRSGRPLSDTEVRDFAAALDSAARALADAETNLNQSQVDYETAKQNEISGLQSAEARVRSAQADLDELLTGADADELASARAQLARAQAELAGLTGGERSAAISSQNANLTAAQARLAQLTADPQSSDFARAEARVAQAQAQVEQAQLRLDDATLRAPFAGTIAAVNVAPGEAINAQGAPVVLIDVSRYLVNVTVDEVDIARVSIGQPVEVLIDALGAPTLDGTVLRLEPLPQTDSAVTAYKVTIEIDPVGLALKPGMTASATIIADERSNVLSVPVAALRREGTTSLLSVAILNEDGSSRIEERAVKTGLTTGDRIEITSGLAEGEQVVVR